MDYVDLLLHRQWLPLACTSPQPNRSLWLKVRLIRIDKLRLFLLSSLPDLLGELLDVVEALPFSLIPDVIVFYLALFHQPLRKLLELGTVLCNFSSQHEQGLLVQPALI